VVGENGGGTFLIIHVAAVLIALLRASALS
jgi:SNF family Na+-dependent transporter